MEHQASERPVDILSSTLSTASVSRRVAWKERTKHILKSYTPAITNKGVTEFSSSGLDFEMLVKICKLQGQDGFTKTLTARQNDNKPRITNVKSVINKLFKYIQKQ